MAHRCKSSAPSRFSKRADNTNSTFRFIQPRGVGLLQAKFEALKRKLEAEGLFAPERKRPLPKFPRRIGIVTSPSGAAVRDMLNVLRRRAPWLQILINPVRVQGTGAAQEIAVAIREFATPNEVFAPVDLIVVTRGGGSIEDLWEFNEEIVARAIFHSAVPIVSAVGHEIDFTICDFRRRSARAYPERCGRIDCPRCHRSPAADRSLRAHAGPPVAEPRTRRATTARSRAGYFAALSRA